MAAPQRSIWKLIPRTGSLRQLLDFLNTNAAACCSHEVVSRSQILQLDTLYKYLLPYEKHSFRSDVVIQFRRFKPMDYTALFKVIIPNTKQLDKNVYGKSRIGNKRSPENIAKHEISKIVMQNHLKLTYQQERAPYLSDWDLLYGYCNAHGYRTPRVFAHKTHKDDNNPHRSTAVAHTEIIPDSGTVILYGDVCDTYGAALLSACQLLKNMVDYLRLPLPEDKQNDKTKTVNKRPVLNTHKPPVTGYRKPSSYEDSLPILIQ